MGENSGVTLSHISEIDELESGKTASILVIAHIKAPLYVTDERRSRAPISVSAVLDRSGSMSGTKLELVKKTMEFVVQNFKEDDRLGVIAYDDDIAEPFPISYMTETDRKRAVSSVQAIQVGGSTNLSGGLFAGIDQIRLGRINVSDYNSTSVVDPLSPASKVRRLNLRSGSIQSNSTPGNPPNSVAATVSWSSALTINSAAQSNSAQPTIVTSNSNVDAGPSASASASASVSVSVSSTQDRFTCGTSPKANAEVPTANISSVWLFTDGLANEGIQDVPMLKTETQRRLAQMNTACSVFTFGFGGDHDANMLRGVSEVGNGMYYYIETEDKIPDAFADCLGGLISVAAQNLRLMATPQSGYRIVKIQTAFKNEVDASTGVGSVQMPDIYSEEARDIIFEVEVPVYATPHAEARAALTFTLQYFNVLSCMQEEVSSVFELRRPETCSSEPKPMPVELDKQRNRILCMEALAQACSIGEHDLSRAQEILKSAIETIERSVSSRDSYCQSLVGDLEDCLGKMENRHDFQSRAKPSLYAIKGSHAMQRSNASSRSPYLNVCQSALNMQSKEFVKKT